MDILVWTTVKALYKLLASVAILQTFLHVRYIPTLITFSSFIGFWHISNNWKEKEVSYEFSVASFLQ
jgi:uncharacterized protein Usg